MPVRPGLYQLWMKLPRAAEVVVGRLGSFELPPGLYVYTGSARGGVDQRLRRHLRAEKRPHWHIDALLPHAAVVEARVVLEEGITECDLHARVAGLAGARTPVPGFGSSDCRCRSHLAYLGRRLPQALEPWGERWAEARPGVEESGASGATS